jgi:uncharacterized membrane protein
MDPTENDVEKNTSGSWRGKIWNRVLTGFLLIMPLAITIWIAAVFYAMLTGWAAAMLKWPVFKELAGIPGLEFLIRLLALFLMLALLYLIGWGAKFAIGKRILVVMERAALKIPMINVVYSTIRHIVDAFSKKKTGMFRKVVLFEYPRKGVYAIGFLTNENEEEWEVSRKTGEDLISVFLPTTPNPTSGYLLFIPRRDCVFLDMGIAEGMRLVISGGAISPAEKMTLPIPEEEDEGVSAIITDESERQD